MIAPRGLGRSFVSALFVCVTVFIVCQLAGGGSSVWASSVVATSVCVCGLGAIVTGSMADSAWHGDEIPMGLGLFLGAGLWVAGLAVVARVIA